LGTNKLMAFAARPRVTFVKVPELAVADGGVCDVAISVESSEIITLMVLLNYLETESNSGGG